ncbi:MAG: UDP-2,3-diacylglucosamine diphosphatase [Marinifilaceae bacterium]
MKRQKFATVVLSDIHLGSGYSKINEVTSFLSHLDCDRLILNGDIIDGWQLQRSTKHWKTAHTNLFKVLMKMMEHQGTQIIYVRGNHDDFMDKILPFQFFNIQIVKDFTLETGGKRYFVTHGDIFDTITTNAGWLAKVGDVGYSLLLWINKWYNHYRLKQGKSYYSLSSKIKGVVKEAVSYISDFETTLVQVAKSKGVDGIICGHIHQPANKIYGDIHYINSGDWVESMSAAVQYHTGEWDIIHYQESEQLNAHAV